MIEPLNIFILGVAYGLTTCSISCLPYLAPYTLGTGGGFRGGVKSSIVFVAGKIFTYSLMGGIAAYFGYEVIKIDSSSVSLLFGVVLVAGGLSFMLRKKKRLCSGGKFTKTFFGTGSTKTSLFTLGIVTSLLPCLPLSALFVIAAQSGSFYRGALYGFIYGIGLILSPIVLAGGFLGFLSKRLKTERPELKLFMTTCSGVILIFMGGVEFIKAFQSILQEVL